MNNIQKIFTVFVVLIAIAIVAFSFRTKTYYGNSVTFTTRAGEKITIEGQESVAISAVSSSYFRIYSGEFHLIAVPDLDDVFSAASDSFPAKNWVIKEGLGIKTTLTSGQLFVVKQVPSPDYKFGVVFVMFFASLFVLTFGNAYFSNFN